MVDQKMYEEQAARTSNARSVRRRLLGILLNVLLIVIAYATFMLGSSIGAKSQFGYISNLMAHQNSLIQENADLILLNEVNESVIARYSEDNKSNEDHKPLGPVQIPTGHLWNKNPNKPFP